VPVIGAPVIGAPGTGAAGLGDAPPDSGVQPVSVAIAVDESHSLSPADVQHERNAAALIALGEISPGSTVTVFGFGSADRPGQTAIDEVCPTTPLDTAANRESLGRCVAGIHPRTPAEGAATDFAEALKYAESSLSRQPANRPKILFLLTDGYLDVPDSARYGSRGQRNAEAGRQAMQTVGRLKAADVAIWPLGFGGNVNMGQLARYAGGGATGSCGVLAPVTPQAIRVRSSADVAVAMFRAYGQARCLGFALSEGRRLSPGRSMELTVTVPRIATQGTIEVIKSDPRVRVTYRDPLGRDVPATGDRYGSSFELAGGNGGVVEALRIHNPLPGRWRVTLDAPAGSTPGDVLVAAYWQTVLRSSILITPPRPRPGQAAVVEMHLEIRPGVVVGPADLNGLSFGVQLRGDGLTGPVQTALVDDGTGPDEHAGDGTFSGQLVVPPSATGALDFYGAVHGPGVVGDGRPAYTRIADPLTTLTAQIRLEPRDVVPGGQIAGTVSFTNTGTAPRTVRLSLQDLRAGAGGAAGDNLTFGSPPTVTVPVGQSELRFVLRVGVPTALGPVPGRIAVSATSAGGQQQVLDQAFIGTTVAYPPGLWQRHRWLWYALIALGCVALLAGVLWARARHAARDVSDLTMVLYRDGQQVHSLTAPDRWAVRFPFAVTEMATHSPRLRYEDEVGEDQPGSQFWEARRSANGTVTVRSRSGEPPLVLQADSPQALSDGLALGCADARLDGADGDSGFWSGGHDWSDSSGWQDPPGDGAGVKSGPFNGAVAADLADDGSAGGGRRGWWRRVGQRREEEDEWS
jgi:hypothetical protein